MTTTPAARPTVENLTGPAASARRAWVEPHMGMPVSIHLRGDGADTTRSAQAVRAAFETFREMDDIFSTYRPQSQLMRLRRKEIGLEACSPLLVDAMAIGEHASRATQGAFTTLLPTLLPTGDGDLAFDPTGLVKGWTVDLAGGHLSDLPGVSWCINAGGDLRVGAHPDLPRRGPGSITWQVGVEDPGDRTRVARAIALTEGAVATSGTAARGAHLYDPATDWMVDRAGSVTVTGPTLLWADIWATALFVGGLPTREAFEAQAVGYAAFTL